MGKHIEVFGLLSTDRYDTFVPPSREQEMRQLLPSVPGAEWKGRLCLLEQKSNGIARYGEPDGSRYIWLRPDTDGQQYSRVSDWYPQPEPDRSTADALVVVTQAAPTMTYAEALRAGYVPAGTALQRGYVSRQANPDDQPVQIAGGTRHGQLYVLLHNPMSNRYCIRQYLRKREAREK